MVAKGVVLYEACVGETTSEGRDNDGGHVSCLPKRGRTEMEHDCESSACCGTYYDVRRAENESAYSSASENPPATRRRTWSPPSINGGYDDPSPCAALRV